MFNSKLITVAYDLMVLIVNRYKDKVKVKDPITMLVVGVASN